MRLSESEHRNVIFTLALSSGILYIVTGNANKVVVYNSIPTKPDQLPDFAIGSPDIFANTLETHSIMSNPIPASNGKNLFVASDFDRKLYVWKKLPDRSGAHPDLVYDIDCPALDIALWRDTLVLAGMKTVYVWKKLPLEGNPPDLIFDGRIGSVRFQELRGVAVDGRYFYLSDFKAGRIYVWKGIPSENSEPAFSLNVEKSWRISSDGNYLVVATFDRHLALIYRVSGLAPDARPTVVGGLPSSASPHGRQWFNGVSKALVSHGHFFVAEGFSRVHAWSKIEDALAGQRAEVILGKDDFEDVQPQIGRNKLHYPAAVWFDGIYLWVGETKFSERLLRFSPSLTPHEGQRDSSQLQNRQSGNHPSAPRDPVVIRDPSHRPAHASDPAASAVTALSQTGWPKFRAELLNTGYSTSTAPHTPHIAWSKKIPGATEFWSSPYHLFLTRYRSGERSGDHRQQWRLDRQCGQPNIPNVLSRD